MSTTTINWDAALARTRKHLKVVETAVRGWTFLHPNWYVRVELADYPPRIVISCLLRARGKSRRVSTGVEIGDYQHSNMVQALSPTEDELREIGDFIGSLETAEFRPRRNKVEQYHPWLLYELRVDYRRYE